MPGRVRISHDSDCLIVKTKRKRKDRNSRIRSREIARSTQPESWCQFLLLINLRAVISRNATMRIKTVRPNICVPMFNEVRWKRKGSRTTELTHLCGCAVQALVMVLNATSVSFRPAGEFSQSLPRVYAGMR